jgi:hypothetical protein
MGGIGKSFVRRRSFAAPVQKTKNELTKNPAWSLDQAGFDSYAKKIAVGLAVMMVVVVMITISRNNFETGNARGDVQSGLTSHAQGLQRKRIVGPAYKRVGAQTNTNDCASGWADIETRERTVTDIPAWCEHAPCQNGLSGYADVEAIAANGGQISMRVANCRAEHAAELVHRSNYKAHGTISSALQHTCLDPCLGCYRCNYGHRN